MSGPTQPAANPGTPPPGTRLGAKVRCSVCGAEAVVTKAGATALVSCHGKPLESSAIGARPK